MLVPCKTCINCDPISLCSFTCSMFVLPRVRLRIGLWSCCFCLAAIIIDFVLSGCIIIEFLLHQVSALLRLSCSILLTEDSSLFDVYSEESSAKRVFSVCWLRWSGRSLMYTKKKKVGPVQILGAHQMLFLSFVTFYHLGGQTVICL